VNLVVWEFHFHLVNNSHSFLSLLIGEQPNLPEGASLLPNVGGDE